ncbi:MAG: AIR synthase-related protein [Ruminiclostridium sp.]
MTDEQIYNTFNMGIGMSIVIPKTDVTAAIALMESFGIKAYEIGEIAKGDEGIIIQ